MKRDVPNFLELGIHFLSKHKSLSSPNREKDPQKGGERMKEVRR